MKQMGKILYIEATTDISSTEDSNTIFKELDEILEKEIKKPWHAVVIDLKNNFSITTEDLKNFKKYISPFRKANKKIFLLHGGLNIKTYLQEQGLNTFFQLKNSINDIKHLMKVVDTKKSKQGFDVNMVNPIISSVIETFKTQCQVEAKPGTPILKNKFNAKADFFAKIYMESESFNGYIFFIMPNSTFFNIMRKMLGEDYTKVNDNLLAGMTDLLNVVYDSSKKEYKANGFNAPQSIPCIINVDEFKKLEQNMDTNLVLPFNSDTGNFFIQISYKNKKPTQQISA